MDESWRERTRAALIAHFERASSPRLVLSTIVVITGAAGLLVSHALLVFGEVRMALRYPIAVGIAYLVFLGLVRAWAEIERNRVDPEAIARGDEPSRHYRAGPSNGFRWWDFLDANLDANDFFAADEGCLVGCALTLIGAVIGGVVISLIASAPALIADVFLDAVLVTLLYKRLKNAARRHWLGTAIKRTWIAAAATALMLSIGGAVIQWHWPRARSIGDLIRESAARR